jgi:transaldolase
MAMTDRSSDTLGQLAAAGVSIWLDDINRGRLITGSLAGLARDQHVTGVTSNPTIFAHALAKSDDYQDQLRDLALRGIEVEEASRAITTYDIRWAADVLRPAFDATGGVDGRVSIEVDPRLANDTEKTIAEARALWWAVDRPNAFIKIPATPAGVPAIARCLSEGISINVTLIFSLERYAEVIDAFFTGLEQAGDRDLSAITSVASFFVSRMDTEVDGRLDKLGTPEAAAVRGKTAIANARLAYELYEKEFSSDRWKALEAKGAHPQKPLWASTSTKDPSFRDTIYIEDLVAPGTVNTMPEATLHAVAEHGQIQGDTIRGTYEEARKVIADMEALGVSYDDVMDVLETEAVEKFAASWQELLTSIKSQLDIESGK